MRSVQLFWQLRSLVRYCSTSPSKISTRATHAELFNFYVCMPLFKILGILNPFFNIRAIYPIMLLHQAILSLWSYSFELIGVCSIALLSVGRLIYYVSDADIWCSRFCSLSSLICISMLSRLINLMESRNISSYFSTFPPESFGTEPEISSFVPNISFYSLVAISDDSVISYSLLLLPGCCYYR